MAYLAAVDMSTISEVVHMFRFELVFLAMFATFWMLSTFYGSSWRMPAAADKKPRRNSRGGAQASPLPAMGADMAAELPPAHCNLRNPSRLQLQDPAWVLGAVQQLCRTQVQRAIELYHHAISTGLDLRRAPANRVSQLFAALITSAIRAGETEAAIELVRECCREGPGITTSLLGSAVKLCTSRQLFVESLAIFDLVAEDSSMVIDDRSIWSCLLFCAVETNATARCTQIWDHLKVLGPPTSKDFGNMIRISSQTGNWQLSLSLAKDMRRAGVDIDSVVYNTVLATCAAAGQTDQARALLEETEDREGIVDVITYNTLCKGYAKEGQMDKCFKLFDDMRSKDVAPSQVTYGILLDCCINEKEMERAAEVFNGMASSGLVMNTVLYTTLIKGLARAGQLDRAMDVYEKMKGDRNQGAKPDLITFSILIKANCDAGHLDVALRLLKGMREQSLKPDEVIFNNLLGGCIHEGNAELGRKLYAHMLEDGVKPSSATFSIFIRLFAQCKLLDEALEMLRTQPEARGVVPEARLFMQLAQACLRDRQGRRAVEVYRLMLGHSKPTPAMHGSLLGMCLKLNMLDTGAEILELAAGSGGRVDARDAMQLQDAAVRKRKTQCAEAISAAMHRLGLSAASC